MLTSLPNTSSFFTAPRVTKQQTSPPEQLPKPLPEQELYPVSAQQAQVYFGFKKMPQPQTPALTRRAAGAIAKELMEENNVSLDMIPPFPWGETVNVADWAQILGEDNPLPTLAMQGNIAPKGKQSCHFDMALLNREATLAEREKLRTMPLTDATVRRLIELEDILQSPPEEAPEGTVEALETAWIQVQVARRLRRRNYTFLQGTKLEKYIPYLAGNTAHIPRPEDKAILAAPEPSQMTNPEAVEIARALLEAGVVDESKLKDPWYSRIKLSDWDNVLGDKNPVREIMEARGILPAVTNRSGQPSSYYLDPRFLVDVAGPDGPIPWKSKELFLDTFDDIRRDARTPEDDTPLNNNTHIVSDVDKRRIESAAHQYQLAQLITAGKQLPLNDSHYVGYLDDEGPKSPQAVFQYWLSQITSDGELELPQGGAPVILKVSDNEKIEDLLKKEVIPLFKHKDTHFRLPKKKIIDAPKWAPDWVPRRKGIQFTEFPWGTTVATEDWAEILGDDNPLPRLIEQGKITQRGDERFHRFDKPLDDAKKAELGHAWAAVQKRPLDPETARTMEAIDGILKAKPMDSEDMEAIEAAWKKVEWHRQTKAMPILETMAFPFLSALMKGTPVPEGAEGIMQAIDDLDILNIEIPGNPQLTRDLQEKIAPLKRQLIGVELLKMQYFERLDIKEVVASLSLGAFIGSSGELIVHNFLHAGGWEAVVGRMATLFVVDVVDNFLGELGAFRSDLDANDLKASREELFGTDNNWEIIKNRFKMQGDAGIFAKRALKSAAKGATAGIAISPLTSGSVSAEDFNIFLRSIGAGVGTWGTALSIPFNIRATLPQLQVTAIEKMREGLIEIPDIMLPASERGKNLTPQEKLEIANTDMVRIYATHLAHEDMMARVGFSASMRAFIRVPIVGAVLLSTLLGVPPAWATLAFMGLAPGMENLLRLMITQHMLNTEKPEDVETMRWLILLAAQGEISPEVLSEQLTALASPRKDQAVGNTLTAGLHRKNPALDNELVLAGGPSKSN